MPLELHLQHLPVKEETTMRRALKLSLLALLLVPALAPQVNGAEAAGCCTVKRIACQANCRPCGGVFEFNCDPATCQSSCICDICP